MDFDALETRFHELVPAPDTVFIAQPNVANTSIYALTVYLPREVPRDQLDEVAKGAVDLVHSLGFTIYHTRQPVEILNHQLICGQLMYEVRGEDSRMFGRLTFMHGPRLVPPSELTAIDPHDVQGGTSMRGDGASGAEGSINPSSTDPAGWSSYVGGGRAVPAGVAPGQDWITNAPERRVKHRLPGSQGGSGRRRQGGTLAPIESRRRQRAESTFASFLEQNIVALGGQTTMGPELATFAGHVLRGRFSGVVAADEVPDYGDGAWVVNVDVRGQPGRHWTSLWREGGQDYFWDSFGRRVERLFSADWARTAINAAPDAEQLEDQNICGQASIAWLQTAAKLGVREALLHA